MPRRVPLPAALTSEPFAYRDGIDAGVGSHRLRGADLDRPFHGVRSAKTSRGDATELDILRDRCAEFVPLLDGGRFFSHETAARLWGCPLRSRFARNDPIHVSAIAPLNAPRHRGVIGHRAPNSVHVVLRGDLPVSDPFATWLALAGTMPLAELVAIGDHFAFTPAIADPRDPRPFVTLEEFAERMRNAYGRGIRSARAALPHIRAGSASRPESLLRILLTSRGIPEPELNTDVHSDGGQWLGRADLVWPRFRTVVEYDGDQHRTSSTQYEKDIARADRFYTARWAYVRVRKHGLFNDPSGTVRRVASALQEGGWLASFPESP